MNGTDLALLALALAFVVLGLAVVVALRNLTSQVEALRSEVAGAPSLDDLQAAVAAAVDPTVDEEPVVPQRVTRVPGAFRSPGVIKAMALGTGTASAARRLRQGTSNGNGNGKH